MEAFTASIDRILYPGRDGWVVAKTSKDSIVVGCIPSPKIGVTYRFEGDWDEHPKYGRRFKLAKTEIMLPTGKEGIVKYLSTQVSGVGIATAKKIAEAIGEISLEELLEAPHILANLNFLTDEQKQNIINDLSENQIQSKIASMICGHGIGMGTVAKIVNKYGADSERVLKENPYILSTDVWGIGFKVADAIAMNIGISPNSPYRVEAALNYVLQEAANEGHVFLQPNDIVHRLIGPKGLIEASGVEIADIAKANKKLIDEGRCVREGDAVYYKPLYVAECEVAQAVRRLVGQKVKAIPGLEEMIAESEAAAGIQYETLQKEAIKMALSSRISIICGGPGTGKSTLTKTIVDIYSKTYPDNEIYLAAPTGRAAKRLGEATGKEAKTIHRLLRYNPGYGGFEYGHDNPLYGPGLLLLDEVSMVDIELMANLLAAVDDLQVVFIGDQDQLPSVGPGSVLRDYIASGVVPVVRLEYNYRQAGGSKISEYANLVCRGEVPPLMSVGDFEYIPVEDADQAVEAVRRLVMSARAEGLNLMDFQILAPMHRGSAGVKNLNDVIREMVNPKQEGKPELRQYRLGDKVMVIKNSYELGVFNGDLGIVRGIERGTMFVDFGDFTQEFRIEHLDLLTLAYASTIHKSQGSEFPLVIMPIVTQHYIMLQRNLLYTGMTRAKRRLVLVGDERAIRRAVHNNKIETRWSMLAERIRGPKTGGGEL